MDDYVQSIWKGENLGGPECADHAAYADAPSTLDRGRIERVCERTEIRTILSGETATPFTRAGCAPYAHTYQQDTIDRACTAASRTSRARDEELNAAQAAACEQSLRQARLSKPSGAATNSALLEFFRKNPRKSSAAVLSATSDVAAGVPGAAPDAAAAEPTAVAAAEPTTVAAAEAASVAGVEPANVAGAEAASVAGAEAASAAASASVHPVPVASAEPESVVTAEPTNVTAAAPASVGAAADRAACEDKFIESIWKGQDLSGSACAVYVGADGYAPSYRIARIQNVCDGATIRSKRLREALPAFTLETCSGALRAHPSPEALERAPAAGAANGTADAPDASPPAGLDPAAIASTIDAHWRSIGRDCMAVAPSSRALPAPANTPVTVTVTVAASGQVRNVSARARGRRQLESCIENSVQSWRFPSASVDTVITIPLLFAGK